jgi:paraquat-inducible protein A
VRCDTALAKGTRLGPDTVLVFSITGLILAVPASLLPFVSAGKLGDQRISLLFTGVGSLWDGGMRALAILVILCGGLLPVALLATLAALRLPARLARPNSLLQALHRIARVLGHGAIPEVQVLAVLVALMKLGSVVDVKIGPGFWFYGAMAVCQVIAQRRFNLDSSSSPAFSGGSGAATQP